MNGTLILPEDDIERTDHIVEQTYAFVDSQMERISYTIEEEMSPIERAIVSVLRLKRTRPEWDKDRPMTAELNEIQRTLEDQAGVTGVELAPEYDVEDRRGDD